MEQLDSQDHRIIVAASGVSASSVQCQQLATFQRDIHHVWLNQLLVNSQLHCIIGKVYDDNSIMPSFKIAMSSTCMEVSFIVRQKLVLLSSDFNHSINIRTTHCVGIFVIAMLNKRVRTYEYVLAMNSQSVPCT